MRPSVESVTDRERAKHLLSGAGADATELVEFAKHLIRKQEFGYARRLLAIAADRPEVRNDVSLPRRIAHWCAMATYKDAELSEGARLDQALDILKGLEPIETSADQQTLGLAGAIFKRKWLLHARRQDLSRSLFFYLRGYEQGITADLGFNAVNAAFILDQMGAASMRDAPEGTAQSAQWYFERARTIRQEVLEILLGAFGSVESFPQTSFWFLVTVAEAYFGLRRFNDADEWLQKAAALPIDSHDLQTVTAQFVALVQLNAEANATANNDDAWSVLSRFTRLSPDVLRLSFSGTYGLALSGGGFRAALFHIGVLARLAEMDVLRHVQVISCVSGGAVLGAHYYLELRRLLQSKRDNEITRKDYIDLVGRLERDFLDGVQRNLLTRAFISPSVNLKCALLPNYSRAEYLGELFEVEILSRVADGQGDKPRWINDVDILPAGESDSFTPRNGNWRRSAKVPVLILNATTLNTGHNWQFTTSWMGEPVAKIDALDANARLRRLYYTEAPQRYRRVRLGTAVAASACSIGLFDPISLPGLYPDYTVRLVDGGVNDNQGIGALFEQDCTVLLVSDASGQMSTVRKPSSSLIEVPLRANAILGARVREAQYRELDARQRAAFLSGIMVLHLKKDLESPSVNWIGHSDLPEPSGRASALTTYGIARPAQERLAAIRSDYDAFSDVEAFALMTSGYLMAGHEFPSALRPASDVPESEHWRFLAVRAPITATDPDKRMLKLLDVGAVRGFKIFKLLPALRVAVTLVGILAATGLALALRNDAVWNALGSMTLVSTVVVIALSIAISALSLHKDIIQTAVAVFMGTVGWMLGWLRLSTLDPLYLRLGSVSVPVGRGLRERVLERVDVASTGHQALHHREVVDRIRRLLEIAGYSVRSPAVTGEATLADIDLIAELDDGRICMHVLTAETRSPVNWVPASRLKRAAWTLSQSTTGSYDGIAAQLVLVDVVADPSLEAFAASEKVGVLQTNVAGLDLAIANATPETARQFLATFTKPASSGRTRDTVV
jgi:predicted acylesterase/phospholipase RssA